MKLLITTWLLLLSLPSLAAEALIAVAANFTQPMRDIAREFEHDTGHHLTLSLGSSGRFFAQIQHGAPFDAFLSADASKPEKLEALGLGVAGTRFTYASGALVLISHQADADALQLLRSGTYRKLAIANPALAPYGMAAEQTLAQMGLLEPAKPRLVQGENISQTLQFVTSGNADLGFVALSQVILNGEPPVGSWPVPNDSHPPIQQDALLLQHGKNNRAAQALLQYLHSDTAKRIMQHYGYSVP